VVYTTINSFYITLDDFSFNQFENIFKINKITFISKKVAVIGCAGGVGASFLAREYAGYISSNNNGNSCLLEKSLFNSTQMLINGITDKKQVSLKDISTAIDSQLLESVTHQINNNLDLCSPLAEYPVNMDKSYAFDSFIYNNFNNVISDYSFHSYNVFFNDVLRSDTIVLVTNGNLTCIKNTSLIISMLTRNGFSSDRIKLVVNGGTSNNSIKEDMKIYKKHFPNLNILQLGRV
ncbi:hypothetical protein, partial [Vibrio mediterranei]|uniref:hypothetical protein n=1 Tax=Vibrio mediterranei TaxID=689 RepID=UPI00148C36FF